MNTILMMSPGSAVSYLHHQYHNRKNHAPLMESQWEKQYDRKCIALYDVLSGVVVLRDVVATNRREAVQSVTGAATVMRCGT